jgi:hypothetical protein
MLIKFKLSDGTGNEDVLVDEDLGDVLEQFDPEFTALNQIEPLLESVNQFAEPRGNVRGTLALSVVKTYSDLELALQSIRTPWSGFLGLTKKYDLLVTQGNEEQTYANALGENYQAEVMGVTVRHRITFSTDCVTEGTGY